MRYGGRYRYLNAEESYRKITEEVNLNVSRVSSIESYKSDKAVRNYDRRARPTYIPNGSTCFLEGDLIETVDPMTAWRIGETDVPGRECQPCARGTKGMHMSSWVTRGLTENLFFVKVLVDGQLMLFSTIAHCNIDDEASYTAFAERTLRGRFDNYSLDKRLEEIED